MKLGDLVIPKEIYEPLYADRTSMYSSQRDQTVYLWYKDTPGVVVKIAHPTDGSNATYCHVYILTGEYVGWTYSDFLLVIHESG